MAELTAPPQFEIVVERSHRWVNINWREIWDYRDLLFLLVKRDFISRYKQTILGPAWFILQPLLNTAVFTIVFGQIAGIPTDGIPAPLFYLCGQLGWNYFSQNITTGSATFVNNAHLFGKVYFPRLIMPVSTIISNLVAFLLQFIPFLLFYFYYLIVGVNGVTLHPTMKLLLSPLLIAETAVLSLGVSLWMSAASAKYRDLVHLNQYLIQIWMFGSAVIYPLSKVPAKIKWLVDLNPMATIVEGFRISLLDRGTLTLPQIIITLSLTILILISGIVAFQRVERTVVDSV
ncbi:MAG: ABC transporter permease [Chthoniobacteraceae bacterium]